MIRKIKRGIKKLGRKLGFISSGATKKREIQREQMSDINDKILEEKEYAEAKAAKEAKKRKQLEEAITEREEKNIPKKLQEQKEKLQMEKYKGSFDWRKFWKRYFNGKPIELYTRKWKKKVGDFYTMVTCDDGQIAIMAKVDGGVEPVIAGSNMKQIFKNVEGLKTNAPEGRVELNLDKEGNWVENIEEKEVPDFVVDKNGNVVETSAYKKPFMERLKEKQEKIDTLSNELSSWQKSFTEEKEKREEAERQKEMYKKMYETSESDITNALEEARKVIESHFDKEKQVSNLVHRQRLADDHINEIREKAREAVRRRVDELPESKRERITKKVMKEVNWVLENVIKKGLEAQSQAQSGAESGGGG